MSPVSEAIEIAVELDQIRQVYGSDCATFVERALRSCATDDWKSIVSAAVFEWSARQCREQFVA